MKRSNHLLCLALGGLALWSLSILPCDARERPAGTGVIVHPDGYVLTAHHVISNAHRIVVVTPGEFRASAIVVSIDEGRDLTLLKIPTVGMFEAPLGYAGNVRLDQPVFVVGFPFGLREASINRGRITAVRTKGVRTVFQIDAAINPGNSGGPLFNRKGEVVGIITTKFSHPSGISPEGMGFALPISFATPLLANIPNFDFSGIGKRGIMTNTEKEEARQIEEMARVTVRIEIERFRPPSATSEDLSPNDPTTEPPVPEKNRPVKASHNQKPKKSEQPDAFTQVNQTLKLRQKKELERFTQQGGHSPQGMLLIPGGEFQRGADDGLQDTRPMRRLYLSAFWIDQYEVTNAQYQQCVQAGVCSSPKDREAFDDPGHAQHPVINVTWLQARSYCHWTGRRLPTEAEWEKAARGTDGRRYPWGDQDGPIKKWWKAYGQEINENGTLPIGTLSETVSPYGVLDLVGNVWEWVQDRYAEDYYAMAPSQNPQGPVRGSFRILRGGDWSQSPLELQVSYRGWDEMTYWGPRLGFRCATDVPASGLPNN